MKYMRLNSAEKIDLFDSLMDMPRYLERCFSGLNDDETVQPGPGGSFSPVEQIWHLADLEREGFGYRIRRLISEENPDLPDFEGGRLALERDYKSKSYLDGLRAFLEARAENLAVLQALDHETWSRRGRQEGVGDVSLCDIPHFMVQHDSAHRAEIEAWRGCRNG